MDLRLKHFAGAKDAAGCRATAETWERLSRTDAGSLFQAARYRAAAAALAPDPAGDADRAMAWLEKAVAGGYRDVEQLKADPDLAALRGRDDFKKLLSGLGAGGP